MSEHRDHPLKSLRQRRQLHQLPATFFASRLGVTVTTFNRFERGERRAYFDQAIVMANLLGCSLEDLGRDVTPEEEFKFLREAHARKHGLQIEREHAAAEKVQHDLADRGFVTEVTESPADSGIGSGSVVAAHTPNDANADTRTEEQRVADMLADWGADGNDPDED